MKTYKIVYSIANQPGKKVMLVQAYNEIDARHAAYREYGGNSAFETNMAIWEVTEVKI